MNFGEALELLKKGEQVQRLGWNGKGMCITMVSGGQISHQDLMESELKQAILIRNIAEGNTENIPSSRFINPYLVMIAADGTIVNGWLASQTDMLAEDWQIVK